MTDNLQTTIVNILEAKPGWKILLEPSSDANFLQVQMQAVSHTTSRKIAFSALDSDRLGVLLKTQLEYMERGLEEAEPPEQSID